MWLAFLGIISYIETRRKRAQEFSIRRKETFRHPFERWNAGKFDKDYPKTLIFVDSLWHPDPKVVPHQLKNTQSGLRVLHPSCWLDVDERKFAYEMMLKKV